MNGKFVLRAVDQSDPTPKYLQAQRILTEAIQLGQLPAGTKLPPTKEIGSMVKVSLITAQRALERLVDAGLLRREVGRGTYVCDNIDEAIASHRRLAINLIFDHHVNMNDYYHAAIIEGLRQEARHDSNKVEFFFQDEAALRRNRRPHAAGAVCIHPLIEDRELVVALAARMPLVVLGGRFPDRAVSCVDCDNYDGARQIVRHLHGLGHRRFLIVSGPANQSNTRDRADGARAELSALGAAFDEQDLLHSKDIIAVDERTAARIRKRLRDEPHPTAVIACGFYLALAVFHAARRTGLDVPRDVSIVGFDDPASAALLAPPLTTVRQPLREMAGTAYQVIRQAIESGVKEIQTHILPAELVVRGSTGPAPQ